MSDTKTETYNGAKCGGCPRLRPDKSCDDFERNMQCRQTWAAEVGTLNTARIADALEKLTAIEELFDDAPAPDLSRLEQELRGLSMAVGVYKGRGEHSDAETVRRKAAVVRRCIAILKGEEEPRETTL